MLTVKWLNKVTESVGQFLFSQNAHNYPVCKMSTESMGSLDNVHALRKFPYKWDMYATYKSQTCMWVVGYLYANELPHISFVCK